MDNKYSLDSRLDSVCIGNIFSTRLHIYNVSKWELFRFETDLLNGEYLQVEISCKFNIQSVRFLIMSFYFQFCTYFWRIDFTTNNFFATLIFSSIMQLHPSILCPYFWKPHYSWFPPSTTADTILTWPYWLWWSDQFSRQWQLPHGEDTRRTIFILPLNFK